MAATSEAMNQFRQSLEIRRQLILKKPIVVMDNIPCEIDEVIYYYKLLLQFYYSSEF